MNNSNSPTEQWRSVPYAEYADHYIVSDFGNVMRVKSRYGNPCTRILKSNNNNGYQMVLLSANGNRKGVKVHVMVALAFLGECPEGMEVDHVDRDRRNNRLTNLEYVTHAENMRRAAAMGFRNGSSLSHAQVAKIRADYANGYTLNEISMIYLIPIRNLRHIINGHTWKLDTPTPRTPPSERSAQR